MNPSSVNQFARVHSLKSLEAMVDPAGPHGSPRLRAAGVPGNPPALVLHVARPAPARRRARRPVQGPGQGRARVRRQAAQVLRRVLRGDGPSGGVLSGDRRTTCSTGTAFRRARCCTAEAGPAGRHPAHGADDRRGRRGRHHHARADPRRARPATRRFPAGWKEHHLQEGAGHYGTFSGRRFREQIAPRMRRFFRAVR